jgi:hypothetical protein
MRLLNTTTLKLEYVSDSELHFEENQYAILSRRWVLTRMRSPTKICFRRQIFLISTPLCPLNLCYSNFFPLPSPNFTHKHHNRKTTTANTQKHKTYNRAILSQLLIGYFTRLPIDRQPEALFLPLTYSRDRRPPTESVNQPNQERCPNVRLWVARCPP